MTAPSVSSKTQITQPQSKIGSGKVEAKTKEETATSRAHEIAADLIKGHESFRSKAYNHDGVWTIGYGNTRYSDGRAVQAGDTITHETALKEHEHHIHNVVIPKLQSKIPHWHSMNDHQKAALISFSYNAGENFYGHKNFGTITHALSHPDNWHKVPAALNLYNKGFDVKQNKVTVLRGLVRRRGEEGALFSKPIN